MLWTFVRRSAKTVAVGSVSESKTLTMPLFSATKTWPSGANTSADGFVKAQPGSAAFTTSSTNDGSTGAAATGGADHTGSTIVPTTSGRTGRIQRFRSDNDSGTPQQEGSVSPLAQRTPGNRLGVARQRRRSRARLPRSRRVGQLHQTSRLPPWPIAGRREPRGGRRTASTAPTSAQRRQHGRRRVPEVGVRAEDDDPASGRRLQRLGPVGPALRPVDEHELGVRGNVRAASRRARARHPAARAADSIRL